MIKRKISSVIATCGLEIIILSVPGELGLGLFVGMYLFPILLLFGVPTSIFSDFLTKRFKGFIRGILAFLIHLFFGALFVLFPILFSEWEGVILFSEIKSLLENFFFIMAILSSSLFWCIDEFLRSKKCKRIKDKWSDYLEKIGELRI